MIEITPAHGDPDRALAVFVHEQAHWPVSWHRGLPPAMQEARVTLPDRPPEVDDFTTYLHIVVCALEFMGLIDVVGEDRAPSSKRSTGGTSPL